MASSSLAAEGDNEAIPPLDELPPSKQEEDEERHRAAILDVERKLDCARRGWSDLGALLADLESTVGALGGAGGRPPSPPRGADTSSICGSGAGTESSLAAALVPEDVEEFACRKVPSIFSSGHKSDLECLGRHYEPNIFAWGAFGGEGVEDDATSLQLRCAARLRARERALKSRDLGAVWRLQRSEMREADAFLGAFDHAEAYAGLAVAAQVAQRPRPPSPWPVAGRVAAARLEGRQTQADYLDELLHANPEGYAAAICRLNASIPGNCQVATF